MIRFLAFLFPAVALAAGPVAAAPIAKPAPDKVELPVPAKAMFVAQVRGVERTRDRLTKMVTAADAAAADAVTKGFEKIVTDALAGRDLKALAPDGRVFLVVTGVDGLNDAASAEVAVLFPTTDYKGFREKALTAEERKEFKKGKAGVDQVETDGETTFLVDLTAKGYVAVTKHSDTAEFYAGKYVTLAPKDMGDAVAEAFLAADVSLFVNMDRVNDEYGDKIKQFRQLIGLLLQQGGGAGLPGLDKKQIELVKTLYDGLFQAAEDAKGLAVGADFRPEGLAFRIEAAFAPDTTSTKALAGEKPGKLDEITALPAGQMSYSAGKLSAKLSAGLSKFTQEYAADEADEKAAKVVAAYLELAAAATAGGFAQANSGTAANLEVVAPKDPEALVAAHLAAVQKLAAGGSFRSVVLKEKPAVKEAARKHAGFTLHEAKFVLDFEATVQAIEDKNLRETTIASMKRFVPEKPTVWFGTDGKRAVKIMAADWDAAKTVLDDLTSGKAAVGANPAFRATRGQLPAEASLIGLYDVAETIIAIGGSIGEMAGTIPGLPVGQIPKLKKPDGGPVYLGTAVVVHPTGFRFEMFVPAKSVEIGKKILAPVFEKKDD